MNDSIFLAQYGRLNVAQKKAVDTIEGPVMVIAGPGTGKTSILTLRIANILRQTDANADSILALTFTESGAYAMRKKLVALIGSAGYKVTISTFHSFCNSVIKDYPERFPRIIGSVAIVNVDQIKIMEHILTEGEFELLRPYGDPLYYVRHVLTTIRSLKREALLPADLKESVLRDEKTLLAMPDLYHEKGAHKGKMKGGYVKQQERIAKNKELVRAYEAYENALMKGKYYDYEDMIIEVIKALRQNAEFLLILQETYQYILADEHQDANNAQNTVLELLSNFHESPNLFIVGDEKQAIFRFQGASLDNFLYFQKLYPQAVRIELEQNYRSQQKILDASHSLIEKNPLPAHLNRVKLRAMSSHAERPIHIAECRTSTLECMFIAQECKDLILRGVPAEEIAVLYRDNKDAFPIAEALERAGLPVRVESDQNLLHDEDVRKLILVCRAVANPTDETLLGQALFVDFLGVPTLGAFDAMRTAFRERRSLHLVLTELFPEFMAKIALFAKKAKTKPFPEVFEMIVRDSGFLQDVLADNNSLGRLQTLETFAGKIRALSAGAKQFFLADFIVYLSLMEDHELLLKSSGASSVMPGVRLMTAHKSKGLEFSHVFIAGVTDGHWGNKKDRVYFHVSLLHGGGGGDENADERRLFYVALTRARESVTITYVREGIDGRELLPSQFIEEIDVSLREVIDTTSFEKEVGNAPAERYTERHATSVSVTHVTYIKQLFLEQGLAVTALNNFLSCPWRYFFVNLIRLPQAQTKHQLYGTAVHETLRMFFNNYREDIVISRKALLEYFEHTLGKMALSTLDYKELLQKGQKSLGGYFDTYKNTWQKNLLTEYSIRGVHVPVELSGETINVVLKGNLDKVELLNEHDVNVVDYKTGKAKSRNELEGKTKDANGNYKRQLIFYKLLLELDEKKRYVMKSGELDFTEPDEKMRYKKERFEITDADVSAVREMVADVSKQIMTASFWNLTCENKECEYCALAELIRK